MNGHMIAGLIIFVIANVIVSLLGTFIVRRKYP